MTLEEADKEAKRRWGPCYSASVGQGLCIIVMTPNPVIREVGRGDTWDAALADADRREWDLRHPFNLFWIDGPQGVLLEARCAACRLTRQRRLRFRDRLTEQDWLSRAEDAEKAMRIAVRKDPLFERCAHSFGDVRPVREVLRRYFLEPERDQRGPVR